MLDIDRKIQFSEILTYLADALDISEPQYKDAVEKYKAVGRWLGKEDSPLAIFRPDIYPQGSFNLGTVVKPITHEDEYDIDLVCQLDIGKEQTTQQQHKQMVGDRLRANKIYAGILDKEGRRCWTLHYSENTKFHMDILPAIPDDFEWLLQLGVPYALAKHAICVTDNVRWHLDPEWPRSNPKGCAAWFKERMKVVFQAKLKFMAEQLRANIEDVPQYKVRTPLQRAIQILKRHRDIMFENEQDGKPISIIITTLAGHAYNNEEDLYDALMSIVRGMPDHIESRDGIYWVPNPVAPGENFADKWEEHPGRAVKFKKWLAQVEKDIAGAFDKQGLQEIVGAMKPSFGERSLNQAMVAYGENLKRQRKNGKLKMFSGTGYLGVAGQTRVRDHTFYGKV